MPRMYVHLSGRDIDQAILRSAGIVKASEAKAVVLPKTCVRCGNVNPAEGESCNKCGMALTLVAALHKDDELEEIKRNQKRILELLEMGARVDPALLQLRKEDLPK
jgi:ribosomal protein L40E